MRAFLVVTCLMLAISAAQTARLAVLREETRALRQDFAAVEAEREFLLRLRDHRTDIS